LYKASNSGARKINDFSQLAHVDDIKSDYCGHWIRYGKKMTTVAVWKQGSHVTKLASVKTINSPDENCKLYTLLRVYFVHNPHQDFKRNCYYLFGKHLVDL